MGRKLRIHLDLLQPDLRTRIVGKQTAQIAGHDRGTKARQLKIQDLVFVRNFVKGPKWSAGIVTGDEGSRIYEVTLTDGRVLRRHIDHLHIRTSEHLKEPLEDFLIEASPCISQPPVPVARRRSARDRHKPDWYTPVSN